MRLLFGALCVFVGAFLALKPFSSLAVLLVVVVAGLLVAGVSELLSPGVADGPGRSKGGWRTWPGWRGVVYLAGALVVLVWPGPTTRVLAVVVGLALVVNGVLDLTAARAARGTARWNAVVGGAASIVFGVLALAWPDVTVLVVALVFGARVVILGVHLIASAVRGDRAHPSRASHGRPRAGWWHLAGNVVGGAIAVVLVLVSVGLNRGVASPDAFYDPPSTVPATPGQLLRSQPFTRHIPTGAKAWKILYTTTREDGVPAVASGIVMVPDSALTGASGGGQPAKVIAWAHGTTGAAPGCAPSVLADTFGSGAMFIQDKVIDAGWAMVATDYVGLGTPGPHPYLVGQGEGRSVLDSIRAAHQLTGVSLAADTVVWGHSQGGGAALWTGVLATTYAPELTIDGIAALAPASNPPALLANLQHVTGGALFASYVVEGYTTSYPHDVTYRKYVRPTARVIVQEMSQHCLSGDKGVLVSVLTTLLLDKPIWKGDTDHGALHDKLVANIPSGPIQAPVLIAQGTADSLVVPASQDAYVHARCAAGYHVDYRKYDGLDHVPLVRPDSPLIPDLITWTTDRFAGKAPTTTC